MLSRTGRLAVLRGRSAELKDSSSRSQIEIQKGGRKDRHLWEYWTKRNVVEEEKGSESDSGGISNLDIRLRKGHTQLAKSTLHGGKRQHQRVG